MLLLAPCPHLGTSGVLQLLDCFDLSKAAGALESLGIPEITRIFCLFLCVVRVCVYVCVCLQSKIIEFCLTLSGLRDWKCFYSKNVSTATLWQTLKGGESTSQSPSFSSPSEKLSCDLGRFLNLVGDNFFFFFFIAPVAKSVRQYFLPLKSFRVKLQSRVGCVGRSSL